MPSSSQTPRSPLIAGLLCILAPSLAMFYLNRGRLGLLYFVVEVAVSILIIWALISDGYLFSILSGPYTAFDWFYISLKLFGAIHAVYLARKFDSSQSLKWFARAWGLVSIFAIPIIFALVLAVGIKTFAYQPFSIPSGSMLPTLVVNDVIWIHKFDYSPKRGDVIVFTPPDSESEPYVQRIVGMPGDHIQLKSGVLYVNRKAVKLSNVGRYADVEYGVSSTKQIETLSESVRYHLLDRGEEKFDNTQEYIVPLEHYFVLGDNRDNSRDSRYFESVSRKSIIGPVVSILRWNKERKKYVIGKTVIADQDTK